MPRSSVDGEVASFLYNLLSECGGNCAVAAARLGLDRSTLWRCIKRGGGANKSTRAKILAYQADLAEAHKDDLVVASGDNMQRFATKGEDIAAARRMLQTLLGALDLLEQTR